VLAGVGAQDLDQNLQSMAEAIAEELGLESCSILLVEDRVLRARGMHGFSEDTREWEAQLGEGVVGNVAATGQPLLVRDVRTLSGHVQIAPETVAQAAVPLRLHGEVIGVLNVETMSPGALSDATLDLLTRLADQISLVTHSARLQAEQRETLGRLQELDRMKSDFVAITSHELRTPLTAIRGFIKTILKNYEKLSTADMKDFLTIVDRQSHRLARLVEDLLMVSKIEAGELTISPEPVAPVSFLGNLLATFGENADRIKLRVEGDPPETMVVDPYRVEQILRNLIHNGLKFSPPKTPITLVVQFGEGAVEMSVHDQGVGIAPQEQERIFERFHQAGDTATRETEGAGLGLYITKRLVEAMGGEIELESKLGRGSTFTIRLPLVEDTASSILDMEAAPVE
jgi:signal transduction histidine kinase